MQRLAVFAALLASGYGFAAGGVLGPFTGLVAAVGVGSGLAIARAEPGTDVASVGATRHAQRIGGILAAIGCLIRGVLRRMAFRLGVGNCWLRRRSRPFFSAPFSHGWA